MKGVCLIVGILMSFQCYALNKMHLNNNGHISATIYQNNENQKIHNIIKFRPDEKTLPPCQNISFIQIEKQIPIKEKNAKSKIKNPLFDKNAIQSKNGFHIDYDDINCIKGESCSAFYIDHFQNNCQYGRNTYSDKFESCIRNNKKIDKGIKQMQYESCVVCKESSKIYSCVKWGVDIDKNANIDSFLEVSDKPSIDFQESLELFNTFYNN